MSRLGQWPWGGKLGKPAGVWNGPQTFNGNVTITGTLTVSGVTTLNADLTVNSDSITIDDPASNPNLLLKQNGSLVSTILATSGNLIIQNDNALSAIQFRPVNGGTAMILAWSGAAQMGVLGAAAVVRQTSGANLTNNVTSGGTDDTVDNVVAAPVDVNASSLVSTRNAIYQLARKVKQLNDGLRLFGYFT